MSFQRIVNSGEHRPPACSSRQLAANMPRRLGCLRCQVYSASGRMLQAGSLRSPEFCIRSFIAYEEIAVSKGEAETEMKRAEILKLVWVRIDAVIETNRTNWQLIAQPRADRVAHVIQPNIFRTW